MSAHYLLDAYNIIKQSPEFADLDFDAGRFALIRWLMGSRPHGSRQNEVTVFFDGKPGLNAPQSQDDIAVIYTYDVSADEMIKDRVDVSKIKKNLVVVSNDKGIVLYVRAQGARVLSVQEFLGKASGMRQSIRKSSVHGSKSISDAKASQINKELSKFWLKDDREASK